MFLTVFWLRRQFPDYIFYVALLCLPVVQKLQNTYMVFLWFFFFFFFLSIIIIYFPHTNTHTHLRPASPQWQQPINTKVLKRPHSNPEFCPGWIFCRFSLAAVSALAAEVQQWEWQTTHRKMTPWTPFLIGSSGICFFDSEYIISLLMLCWKRKTCCITFWCCRLLPPCLCVLWKKALHFGHGSD